jgi:hypothetical protein
MVVCHPVIPTSTTGPSGRRVMAPDEHIGATIAVITIDQDRTGSVRTALPAQVVVRPCCV